MIQAYASRNFTISEQQAEKIKSSGLGMISKWSPQQFILVVFCNGDVAQVPSLSAVYSICETQSLSLSHLLDQITAHIAL